MSEPSVDHYTDRYWNDHPRVLAYLQRRSTGDPTLWWMDYFKKRYAATPFARALVIGCGRGWVERDLFDRGIAREFDAFDAAEHYLLEAEERRGDRPIRYFRSDFSSFRPDRRYDLILNVAALHHAQYLYRVVARLADAMEDDGLFVNWDYVGPSRNQYRQAQVEIMRAVNESLPAQFRNPHALRPDFEEMAAVDPTEAVHAQEILPALRYYFDIFEEHQLGGGIAYQLLWNNHPLFEPDDPEAAQCVDEVLRLDEQYTEEGRVPNLFSFIICRRRARPKLQGEMIRLCCEPVREALARRAGNRYPFELARRALRQHPAVRRAVGRVINR